ncbi:MAG: hypothetical protein Q8P44_10585 [Dehalococcoidia bacterium]|nr:hypothetical protein [Dehalococcoidia bacterium]
MAILSTLTICHAETSSPAMPSTTTFVMLSVVEASTPRQKVSVVICVILLIVNRPLDFARGDRRIEGVVEKSILRAAQIYINMITHCLAPCFQTPRQALRDGVPIYRDGVTVGARHAVPLRRTRIHYDIDTTPLITSHPETAHPARLCIL